MERRIKQLPILEKPTNVGSFFNVIFVSTLQQAGIQRKSQEKKIAIWKFCKKIWWWFPVRVLMSSVSVYPITLFQRI